MKSANDDYIIVTESRNFGEDGNDSDDGVKIRKESEDASARTLESAGIFLENENKGAEGKNEPRDELSHELLEQGGIEIGASGIGEEEGLLG